MLCDIHIALQRLLYQYGNIHSNDVEIRFEAPDKDQIEQLTRPTIYIFLVTMQENIGLRQHSFERATPQGSRMESRHSLRRFDLRYMISVLANELTDEHLLLWRVLLTLLHNPYLPPNLLSDELRNLEPPLVARVEQHNDDPYFTHIWQACGLQPRPTLSYIVTVPIEKDTLSSSPLVLSQSARQHNRVPERVERESKQQIGGVIHNIDGRPLAGIKVSLDGRANDTCVTDAEGGFTLRQVPSGLVRLRITQPDRTQKIVLVDVPDSNITNETLENNALYDIILKTNVQ